jgi:signal transduction histidine kinase
LEHPKDDILVALQPADWLRTHWDTFLPTDPSRVYAAIVDTHGTIVLHNREDHEGLKLGSDWFSKALPLVGDDVVETNDPKLSGSVDSYDISLPILRGEKVVGSYHSGLNAQWFENQVALRRTATWERWLLAFSFISLVIALAGVSIFHVTRRLSTLQNALALGHVRRLADLGQLAGGIAHEIRNPLNAIRLNLHVMHRLFQTKTYDDERDAVVIRETVHEMERVDDLLRALLEYAQPDRAHVEKVDLPEELRSIGEWLRPTLSREKIALEIEASTDEGFVVIDRSRFRQLALNLLKNAMEAIGTGGTIRASLQLTDDEIIFAVRDDGCGINPRVAERIFEPFFTTKELGTGLGLTLVRRTVEEEGGSIRCEPASPRGTVFTVRLPRRSAPEGASSKPAAEKTLAQAG